MALNPIADAYSTSPRLRGEQRPPLAAVLIKERRSEASAIALFARRVRGTLRESNVVERAPHPNPLPASGEREKRGTPSLHLNSSRDESAACGSEHRLFDRPFVPEYLAAGIDG